MIFIGQFFNFITALHQVVYKFDIRHDQSTYVDAVFLVWLGSSSFPAGNKVYKKCA